MAVSVSDNKHRHMISTVIFQYGIRQIYSIYYLSVFPVFFPRPVPIPGSYVSGTFALIRYAGCIFKPDIILGRLFSFQGAWDFIPSPIQLFMPAYTTTFESFLTIIISNSFNNRFFNIHHFANILNTLLYHFAGCLLANS